MNSRRLTVLSRNLTSEMLKLSTYQSSAGPAACPSATLCTPTLIVKLSEASTNSAALAGDYTRVFRLLSFVPLLR